MKNDADHNQFIAAWRGIAVLIVVYYHYVGRLPVSALGLSEPPSLPMQLGKLGVFIFFIISGFLIAKSMAGCRNLAEFIAKRLSRIWPLYIFAILVIFVFINLFTTPVVETGPKAFNNEAKTIIDVVANMLFLNDLGFVFIDGVFWSIIVEVKFYFIFGIFVVAFRARHVEYFAIFAVIIAGADFLVLALANVGPISFGDVSGPLSVISAISHRIFIAQYLPFFAVGVLLYDKNYSMILTVAIGLCVVCMLIAVGEDMEFVTNDNIRFVLALSILLFFDRLVLGGRIIEWIGDMSFSIYLFHQIIGLTIISTLAPMIGLDAAIFLTLMIVLLISAVASWLVEWRFRRPVTTILMHILTFVGLDKLKTGARTTASSEPQSPKPARASA